jgi:hypothetical protein
MDISLEKKWILELRFYCIFISFSALFYLTEYESREMVGGTSGKMQGICIEEKIW